MPIANKLTVRREVKVRDTEMTDDMKEEDALLRYLEKQGISKDIVTLCLQEHESLIGEGR